MQASFPRAHNATREKNLETSFQTNQEHPAQTSRDRGRVRRGRWLWARPERATFRRTGVPGACQRPRGHRWKYRNLRLFRTAGRFANSIRVRHRRGTVPYSAKTEWGHALESLVRSFGVVDSQFLLAAVGAILRRADEHFDEVNVHSIVELALEAPFELGMVEIARMEVEVICMHGHGCIFELDHNFDSFAL